MLSRLVRGQAARTLMLALSATTVATTGYLATRGHAGAPAAKSEQLAAQELCPAGYEYEDPLEVAERLNPGYAKAHEADIRRQFGDHFCFMKNFAPLKEAEGSEGAGSPYSTPS